MNRLGTLTYAGVGCYDPRALRRHVAEFFRALRALLGGKAFPYLWVAEWHPGGHGLHVHFAVGRYIKRSLIERAWGRGFVHIKHLGNLPAGSGTIAEARVAAGYLAPYVGKDFDAQRMPGLHRYEVAQGFQPAITVLWGPTRADVIEAACRIVKAEPQHYWFSDNEAQWQGPPAMWLQWPG